MAYKKVYILEKMFRIGPFSKRGQGLGLVLELIISTNRLDIYRVMSRRKFRIESSFLKNP
jgi:hypothetical protein